MIHNSTYYIKQLERSVSYKPSWLNLSPRLKDPPQSGSPLADSTTNNAASSGTGPGTYNKLPIFKFLVAKNALSNLFVRVWTIDHESLDYVDIPCDALIKGNEYSMYLSKYEIVNGSGAIQTNQDANFILIGYLTKNIPYDLQ